MTATPRVKPLRSPWGRVAAAGWALWVASVALGAGPAAAQPVPLRFATQVQVAGAWVTAADLLPQAASGLPALAALRVAAAPACGRVALDWSTLAQTLHRAWPGRFAALAHPGATTVHGLGEPADAAAVALAVQQALDQACGGAGRCQPAPGALLPTPCVPAGALQASAVVPRPGVAAGASTARVRLAVQDAPQVLWTLPVQWLPAPAWRVRHAVPAGQALSPDDLQSVLAPGGVVAAAVPLHFDPVAGLVRAPAGLQGGELLPGAVSDFLAAGRAGEAVRAVAEAGRVQVQRQVVLTADATPGRAAWAQADDGRMLRLQPGPSPATAPWKVLP